MLLSEISKLPPSLSKYADLLETALNSWFGSSQTTVGTIDQGRSSSVVFSVNISGAELKRYAGGAYIIKLGYTDPSSPITVTDKSLDEGIAYDRAVAYNDKFARKHLAEQVAQYRNPKDHSYAFLYKWAGESLEDYKTCDAVEASALLDTAPQLSVDLLAEWSDSEPRGENSIYGIFEAWLGSKLDPVQNTELFGLLEDVAGDESAIPIAGTVVLNPRSFLEEIRGTEEKREWFTGFIHGDLHGGNILVDKMQRQSREYSLIDFSHARAGVIGYDQGYLELYAIVRNMGKHDVVRLLEILTSVDIHSNRSFLPDGSLYTFELLTQIRNNIDVWISKNKDTYRSTIEKQILCGRIAAGLNWASKRISHNQKLVSLVYSAWYCRLYTDRYLTDTSKKLLTRFAAQESDLESEKPSVANSETDEELWEEFLHSANNFKTSNTVYVLIAEAQEISEEYSSLGQIPWSLVIDLDPDSQNTGVSASMSPVLDKKRSVKYFDGSISMEDGSQSTYWMMAAGWNQKNSPAVGFKEWKISKSKAIRTTLEEFAKNVNPKQTITVVLTGKTLDKNMPFGRVFWLLDEISISTGGTTSSLVVGPGIQLPQSIDAKQFDIESREIVRRIYERYGTHVEDQSVSIPSANGGWVVLNIESLIRLEEYFQVMHSRVLDDDQFNSTDDESCLYWRGAYPSARDMFLDRDVLRAQHRSLVDKLREELEKRRNYTLVFEHTPGAGGSTMAIRAAWELHWDYPEAVLKTYSRALSDRLQVLHETSESSVLLVAESSILSATQLEDLYHDLRDRNCRVVILYIKRVLSLENDVHFGVDDPMTTEESADFLAKYSLHLEDKTRLSWLRRISHREEYKKYRTPFFYGLITFEKEFRGVDEYIRSHIADMRGRIGEVMQYLAFVSIYSNTGINDVLIRRLLRFSDSSVLSPEEMFGPGPLRLLVQEGDSWRFMHQVLAEEILKELRGGSGANWRQELIFLALGFIREISSVSDDSSEVVVEMLKKIFVERVKGSFEETEDRQDFAPLIEEIDSISVSSGHTVLTELAEKFEYESHFWNHLGRHFIYKLGRDEPVAEQHLERAVNLSSEDPIHHHTLGLVLRSRIKTIFGRFDLNSGLALLDSIGDMYDRASLAFSRSRELRPEGLYGYITNIQLICEIANKIKYLEGVDSITNIRENSVREWVFQHVSKAEELFSLAQGLYSTVDSRDRYIVDCETKLNNLYGDIDRVIELWELYSLSSTVSVASQRSLAHAYLAREGRKWSQLAPPVLRRIVELMEYNLQKGTQSGSDYRLWFEAIKMLPEFNIDDAISRLSLWGKSFPNWRASYYLYILHFLLWFEGRTQSPDEFEEALEICQKLLVGRKTNSDQWLAVGPGYCPIISSDDMGQWDKTNSFWSDIDDLRRINGSIDSPITGPQAGKIVIDGRVKAFFVPGTEFQRNIDENRPVSFHLGFSPRGLRAWSVTRGHIQSGSRLTGISGATLLPTPVHREREPSEVQIESIRNFKKDRIYSLIDDLLTAYSARFAVIEMSDIRVRVEAIYGISLESISLDLDKIQDKIDQTNESTTSLSYKTTIVSENDVENARRSDKTMFGRITYIDKDGWGYIDNKYWVTSRLTVGNKKDLFKKNRLVEFVPDVGSRGSIATMVDVKDKDNSLHKGRLATKSETFKLLEIAIKEHVNDALPNTNVNLNELTEKLNRIFEGHGQLHVRLGFASNVELINWLEGPSLFWKNKTAYVKWKEPMPIGKLSNRSYVSTNSVDDNDTISLLEGENTPIDYNAGVKNVLENISKHGTEGSIKQTELSRLLTSTFPGGEVAMRIGFDSFEEFLRSIDSIEIESMTDSGDIIWRRCHDVSSRSEEIGYANQIEDPIDYNSAVSTILDYLESVADHTSKVSQVKLAGILSKAFPGSAPAGRIGYKSFGNFMDSITCLDQSYSGHERMFSLVDEEKHISDTNDQIVTIHHSQIPGLIDYGRAVEVVLEFLESDNCDPIGSRPERISNVLDSHFPGGSLASRLGYSKISEFLYSISEIDVSYDDNGEIFRIRD